MSENDFNKLFSKNLKMYMELNNINQAELARRLNVSTAAVNTWCNGLKSPRMDKVDSMCSIFGCRRSDLIEDKNISEEPSYYQNRESAETAEFLFKNPEYKVLFDASKKVKPQDIDFVADMINRVAGNNDDTGC